MDLPRAYAIEERAKYEKMWQFDSYRERSPGLRFLDDALERLKPPPGSSIIDLGCGTGRVSAKLKMLGYNVTAVDIAMNSCQEFDGRFIVAPIWDLPRDLERHQVGFCADVMEHIPTDMIEACFASMSKVADVCYMQIANFVCHEGDKIGEHLHLTVKPAEWWKEKAAKYWKRVEVIIQPKHHIVIAYT